jgi:zinc and cadmium transporter
MAIFLWILVSTLAGGVLSVGAAAAVAFKASPARIPMLISYAVGALLGAVFLEILPHAFGMADSIEQVAGTILAGILAFFVLEKLVLWRHCHVEQCEAHDPVAVPQHDHGRSGMMIIIGDTFHNFVDGILIATAFLANHELGIVTAVAIIAHEIPQEVGDFAILLHSGYTRARALAMNLLSSTATIVGGVLGYYTLHLMEGLETILLGIVAASMIYVAVADLIPGLHRRPEFRDGATQTILIALGIGCIALVRALVAH